MCFLSTSPYFNPSALWPPPWLPKQCPRFLSAPEHHGILVVIPAELPVLPPDPPLLRLPVTPEPAEESAPPPTRRHCTPSAPAKASLPHPGQTSPRALHHSKSSILLFNPPFDLFPDRLHCTSLQHNKHRNQKKRSNQKFCLGGLVNHF